MAGFSISDILECCYGPNAVIHMSRAVIGSLRGHSLIESGSHILILQTILDTYKPPVRL